MKVTVAVLVVLAVSLFVFQAWGEESKFAGQTIDVTKMTCKELMGGNDNDRAVGFAYFHGFLAGKKNKQIIDVNVTSAQTDRVRDYCLSNPDSTVMDAFTKSAK